MDAEHLKLVATLGSTGLGGVVVYFLFQFLKVAMGWRKDMGEQLETFRQEMTGLVDGQHKSAAADRKAFADEARADRAAFVAAVTENGKMLVAVKERLPRSSTGSH